MYSITLNTNFISYVFATKICKTEPTIFVIKNHDMNEDFRGMDA
jgi:hypothetical protein